MYTLGNSTADAAVSLLLWTVPASALNGTAHGALERRTLPLSLYMCTYVYMYMCIYIYIYIYIYVICI